jgi:hypothetical protein
VSYQIRAHNLLLHCCLPTQACTANPQEDEQGFPCITKLSKDPAVAPIVEDQHAINVFVAGALLCAAVCCCVLLLP